MIEGCIAYNADAPLHERAKIWWEDTLNSRDALVGLSWVVSLGFVRIMTHPRVLVKPLSPEEAVHFTLVWLMRPNVEALIPGERHLDIFLNLVRETGHAGSLTTDLHIAVLALEHHATVCSNDADFSRFSGLKTINPLV